MNLDPHLAQVISGQCTRLRCSLETSDQVIHRFNMKLEFLETGLIRKSMRRTAYTFADFHHWPYSAGGRASRIDTRIVSWMFELLSCFLQYASTNIIEALFPVV